MAVTPPAAGSGDPVVQLTTLPGWRQFVAAVPSIPNLFAEQEWLALEDGKRAAHVEERLEHHARLVVIQTPVIERIVKRGGDLIRMNRVAHYGRSGLMVSGPARTGKTTAVTQLGKTAEVMHRHRHPHSRDDIPVIYITVPPAATGKMISMELARFLGLPVITPREPDRHQVRLRGLRRHPHNRTGRSGRDPQRQPRHPLPRRGIGHAQVLLRADPRHLRLL